MSQLMYPVSVVLGILIINSVSCIQFSVGVEHDMSQPTYGLKGRSSSSLHYDNNSGLVLNGTIADILGPPIKIANGLGNIIHGSNMAGAGSGLRAGGALLGVDAKLLEAAGGLKMAKGGLLLAGAVGKTAGATALAGPVGKKLASIIEVPVKVVAVKDLATGKVMHGLGQLKQAEAQAIDAKGQTLVHDGQALKSQGYNQVMQGASEGVQNIGAMVQKTAENVNTAFKYLPLIMEMQQDSGSAATKGGSSDPIQQQPIQQQPIQQQPIQQQPIQQQQHYESTPHHQISSSGAASSGLTGGSPFGGLASLVPGLGDPFGLSSAAASSGHYNGGQQRPQLGSLFGANGPNPLYAAMINSTSPLTNLLLHPNANPFLLPFSGGPLTQALANKQPIGTEASGANSRGNGQSSSFSYNLLPGIRLSESSSSHLPTKFALPQQQQQGKVNEQQQQQQIQL